MIGRENGIEERSFEFAGQIVRCCRHLRKNKEYDLARQLLRSGTAIGANVQEAQAALTKREFIAKMSIAAKEARETDYWLRLLSVQGILDSVPAREQLLTEIVAIQKILTSIIKTAQKNLK